MLCNVIGVYLQTKATKSFKVSFVHFFYTVFDISVCIAIAMCSMAAALDVSSLLITLQWQCSGNIPLVPFCGDIPWLYVSCEHGRVTEINLYDVGVSGYLPTAIGYLTSLQTLDLSYNNIQNMPSSLGLLTALTRFDFISDAFTGPIPTELGGMVSVTHLFIQGRNIYGEVPSELGNLRDIVELSFNSRSLSGALPPTLCHDSLTYLSLEDTGMSCYAECFGAVLSLMVGSIPECELGPPPPNQGA